MSVQTIVDILKQVQANKEVEIIEQVVDMLEMERPIFWSVPLETAKCHSCDGKFGYYNKQNAMLCATCKCEMIQRMIDEKILVRIMEKEKEVKQITIELMKEIEKNIKKKKETCAKCEQVDVQDAIFCSICEVEEVENEMQKGTIKYLLFK